MGSLDERREGDRRTQIIEAALESLREVGYAGTSIREIARRGGFNSALISYYFSGLHGLLLEALDYSSAARMRRYRDAIENAGSPEALLESAREIYREDLEGGHITVFTEMVAASLAHESLAPELVARVRPWLELVESAVEKVAGGSPLLQLLPAAGVAYAIVCFYLGVNVLTQLERDSGRLDDLFDAASRLAPLVGLLTAD